MKFFIMISMAFSLAFSSEYVSLMPSNSVDFLSQKLSTPGSRADISVSIKGLGNFTKNAENPSPYSTTNTSFNPDLWYTPEGWHSYKMYIPAGLRSASFSISSKPNASLRLHLTFKATGGIIDHTITPYNIGSTYPSDNLTHSWQVQSIVGITLPVNLIDTQGGGWLYIDVVEDSANQNSYFGDVDPDLGIGLTLLAKNTAEEMTVFNEWKSSVATNALGDPGDAINNLTIIDKVGPTNTASRIITMDPADDPNADSDNDGYLNKDDCAPFNSDIHPGAVDIPNNGIDEDCSGSDALDLTKIDNDNDGEMADTDCNDNDPRINSKAVDIPNNGIDENCDGVDLIDLTVDYDMDGEPAATDCDDYNINIHHGASEIPNNGIDEDCNGADLVDPSILDSDRDGYMASVDCNDNNRYINPGATEIPNNGIDENCDGVDETTECDFWNGECEGENPVIKDEDNDGYGSDVDCNDNNPAIHPDATEIAGNGIDEDCKNGDAPLDTEGSKIDLRREAQNAASAVSGRIFSISGMFSQYPFYSEQSMAAYNWVYTDLASGIVLQLLGNDPTPNDVFGWVQKPEIKYTTLERNWYMFSVDINNDGSIGPFEWVIISANPNENRAYKLSGARDNGTFLYSEQMDSTYKIINGVTIQFQ